MALLVAVAIVLGVGDGFFNPSFGGMIPLVVGSARIASANSLVGFARQGSAVVGPALAGILYESVTSAGVFAIDAVTYAFAIALLLRIPAAKTRPAAATTGTTLADIRDGLRYVGGVPWLWVTFTLFASTGLLRFAPQQVLLPQLIDEHFHLGVGSYALLVSFIGLGLTAGMLAFGQLAPRRSRGRLLYLMSACASLFFAGVAVSPVFAVAVGLATLHGLAFGFAIGLWETVVVELVPGYVLSRVISINYLSAFGLLPLGMLITGVAAGFFPPGAILGAGAVCTAALFIAVLPRNFIQMLD
jgi:MFS family permease